MTACRRGLKASPAHPPQATEIPLGMVTVRRKAHPVFQVDISRMDTPTPLTPEAGEQL